MSKRLVLAHDKARLPIDLTPALDYPPLMSNIAKTYRFGIIGGGQLARMLVQAGQNLGFEMHVLSDSNEDPAAQVTSHHHSFQLSDRIHLERFIDHMTFITFESEFVDPRTFWAFEPHQKKKFYPSLETMALFRNRKTQKQWFLDNKLPTAKFISNITNHSANTNTALKDADLQNTLQKLHKLFPNGFVLKKTLFGYDGYGTWVSSSKSPLEKINAAEWIAEEKISFKRELAVQFARTVHGDIIEFPLVQSHQEDNRCDWVKGPIPHRKWPALRAKIIKALSKVNYVGVIAFELFDAKGQLLINEVAPRVHNSGHHTLQSMTLSQFHAHLLSALPTQFQSQLQTKGFAMANLIGPTELKPDQAIPEAAFVHWYGKKDLRPGRKVGHLNSLAKTAESALKLVLKARRGMK